MIMEVPLLAFKFKSFGWKENQLKYIFLGVSVVLLILLKFAAVPLIVGIYILLSFIAPKSPKGA
jgi:CDP-diacylglycerol--serine O-phosphatidyltransferase